MFFAPLIQGAASGVSAPILLDDPLRAAGSSELLIGAVNDDHTGASLRDGGVALKRWAADINAMMAAIFARLP